MQFQPDTLFWHISKGAFFLFEYYYSTEQYISFTLRKQFIFLVMTDKLVTEQARLSRLRALVHRQKERMQTSALVLFFDHTALHVELPGPGIEPVPPAVEV